MKDMLMLQMKVGAVSEPDEPMMRMSLWASRAWGLGMKMKDMLMLQMKLGPMSEPDDANEDDRAY